MKYKSCLGVIILLIFSTLVFADAPPPIPTEYWGRLLIDGQPAPDGTEVKYFNGEEWIITTTTDGWYNIILTGGDSPLTYNDDPDCSTHWANEEACIPCTQDVDCVEGPQEGDTVSISADNVPASVIWDDDASSEENVIALIPVNTGWNMISLPILPVDTSPQSVTSLLSGHRVVYYYDAADASDHWKSYDSNTPSFTWDLNAMNPSKGYWLKVDSDQTLSVVGTVLANNIAQLFTGWNLVSFQLYKDIIENAMNKLAGHRVAYYYEPTDASDHWKSYDSNTPPFTWDLDEVNIGNGYWVKVDSNQNWVE